MSKIKFCPECYRVTRNNICIVHGEVEAQDSKFMAGLYEALVKFQRDVEGTNYPDTELRSEALTNIVEVIKGSELDGVICYERT